MRNYNRRDYDSEIITDDILTWWNYDHGILTRGIMTVGIVVWNL